LFHHNLEIGLVKVLVCSFESTVDVVGLDLALKKDSLLMNIYVEYILAGWLKGSGSWSLLLLFELITVIMRAEGWRYWHCELTGSSVVSGPWV
jgi:hypothetical protein